MRELADSDRAAAIALYARLQNRVGQLERFPELGPVGRREGTRELVVTGTPYVLVYRLRREVIEIAAVWHARRAR